MTGFAKLFGSIIHSTIWRAPDNVRLVWITMLAIKDIDGVVEASIPGLAHAAGQTIEETEDALAMLMAPDPYSRTPDHEGRRIAIVDGGWLVLNHDKYRDKLDKEESHRKKVARQTRWKDGRRRRPEAVGVAERRSEAVGGAGRPHTDTDTDARSGQSARSVSDPCGSGSSQLPDPDLGGRRDLVQGRGGAREAGFRVPQPSELQVATSAPVGARPVPVDPMVAARGALVRELGAQHRAAFNRARDDLRPERARHKFVKAVHNPDTVIACGQYETGSCAMSGHRTIFFHDGEGCGEHFIIKFLALNGFWSRKSG